MLMNFDNLNPFYSGDDFIGPATGPTGALTGDLEDAFNNNTLTPNEFSNLLDAYGIPHEQIMFGESDLFTDSVGNTYHLDSLVACEGDYVGSVEFTISPPQGGYVNYHIQDDGDDVYVGTWDTYGTKNSFQTSFKDGKNCHEYVNRNDNGSLTKIVFADNGDGTITVKQYEAKNKTTEYVEVNSKTYKGDMSETSKAAKAVMNGGINSITSVTTEDTTTSKTDGDSTTPKVETSEKNGEVTEKTTYPDGATKERVVSTRQGMTSEVESIKYNGNTIIKATYPDGVVEYKVNGKRVDEATYNTYLDEFNNTHSDNQTNGGTGGGGAPKTDDNVNSQTSSETSESKTSSQGGSSKFSIENILKSDLITDPNILYENIIDEGNYSSFDSFQNKIINDSNKIITLIGEIDATLVGTNSNAFQSKEYIAKLNQGLEDTTNAKNVVGRVLSSEVKDIINKFNEELRKKRKETRRYLADKTAKDINSKNLENKSKRKHGGIISIKKPSDTTQYEDGIYRVERKWSLNDIGTGIMNWKSTTYYYYDFKYDEGAKAAHIEGLLQKAGLTSYLPYEINKIVDD